MKKNAPAQIFPSSSSQRPLIAPAHSNSEPQDLSMPHISEILFVDPSIADIETVLGNLRPEVHAILLDRHVPASRQIAAALEGQSSLDAVHIMAHGSPGQVHFAAGAWSVDTLQDAAEDFAIIGRALAAAGELRFGQRGLGIH
jgi:hypothetical protein